MVACVCELHVRITERSRPQTNMLQHCRHPKRMWSAKKPNPKTTHSTPTARSVLSNIRTVHGNGRSLACLHLPLIERADSNSNPYTGHIQKLVVVGGGGGCGGGLDVSTRRSKRQTRLCVVAAPSFGTSPPNPECGFSRKLKFFLRDKTSIESCCY